jgi:hypothetical protein
MSTVGVCWIWFRYFHPYLYLKIRYRWKTCPGDKNGLVRCCEVSTHKHMCWIICKSCFNSSKYTYKRIGNWQLNVGASGWNFSILLLVRVRISTHTSQPFPWCRVLLEKLIDTQLLSKFLAFFWSMRVHKTPLLFPVLSQINEVQTLSDVFF